MSLLVATVGAATANSYGTRQESITYFQLTAHPDGETWARLENEKKDAYLIQATRDIEMEKLAGTKKTTSKTAGVPDQALHFPRTQDTDSGTAFVPVDLKHAEFEQALYLYQSGQASKERRQRQEDGVEEIAIGDTREKYNRPPGASQSALSSTVKTKLIRLGYITVKGRVKV